MRKRCAWASVLVAASVLSSGCADEGSTASAARPTASIEPKSWNALAVHCPPLTAAGFQSTKPFQNPMMGASDDAGQLGMMCSYRHDPKDLPVVTTRLQIDRDPAKSGYSAEVVKSDQAEKKAKGQAVIELPAFEGLATASADGSGPVEAVTYSKNARLFAIVMFDQPVKDEAEIRRRADVLTAVLRDMNGNLRPA